MKYISILFILLIVACGDSRQEAKEIKEAPNIRSEIFRNEDNTGFGYRIYLNNTLYIHQPHLPALSGNQGFSSEEDAKRTADLAIYKIRNNIIPPTISPEELDSLGVKR